MTGGSTVRPGPSTGAQGKRFRVGATAFRA